MRLLGNQQQREREQADQQHADLPLRFAWRIDMLALC